MIPLTLVMRSFGKSSTQKPIAHSHLLLVLVTAIIFGVMTTIFMLGPLLVELSEEFDASVSVVGQLVTVTALLWGFSGLSAGPFSDTYGRRPVILLGLVLMAVGTLSAGLSVNYGMLLVSRLLTGLGGGMVPTTCTAALLDFFPPERRGRVIGLSTAISSLAPVVAVPLLTLEVASFGWRLSFFTVGAALGILAVLVFLIFPGGHGRGNQSLEFLPRIFGALRQTESQLIIGANVLIRLNFIIVTTYVAAFLIESYDLTLGQVALPLSITALGVVVASILGGLIADRPHSVLISSSSVIAAGGIAIILFGFSPALWVSVLLGTLVNLALSLSMPTILKILTSARNESRGTMMGLFSISNQGGFVLGAALGGLFLGLGGFSWLGYLCLASSIPSAILITAIQMRRQQASGQGGPLAS